MNKFETLAVNKISNERKLKILEYLNKIEVFNSFLSDRLKTSKRFGVEGCDTIISGLSKQSNERRCACR
jgi:2-oxoglutarate dehydrogenase E1 component